MLIPTVAGITAGFGLFFVGVWTLTETLKNASGRKMRKAVLRWTRSPVQGFGWGAVMGAGAQSMAAAVFILTGMLGAGLIGMRAALPALAGANVGSSLLVFLSTIDLEIAVLFVLGVSGIVLTQIDRDGLRPLMQGLFGLGLLFLGIGLIQENAAPLVQRPAIADLLAGGGGSLVALFLAGVVLCVIAQSVGAVTILAISLAEAGILTLDQTILAVYGANVGSGIVIALLSMGLRGSVRQIAILQIVVVNFVGTAVLVGLFYVETSAGVPLVKALIASLGRDTAEQMAFLYLVLCLPIVMVVPLPGLVAALLARAAPPSRVEIDGRPEHLPAAPAGAAAADAALGAAEREQRRLLRQLGTYFDVIERGEESGHSARSAHASAATLLAELGHHLEELGERDLAPEEHARLYRLTHRQGVLSELSDALRDLASGEVRARAQSGGAALRRFAELVTTALDATTRTAISALSDGNAKDRDRLAGMVGDRSDVLERVRTAYATERGVDAPEERRTLLELNVLAERVFWSLDILRRSAAEPA